MKYSITAEQRAYFKKLLDEVKTTSDLADLLNDMFATIESFSFEELKEGEDIFIKKKKQFTEKQLKFFASSFKDPEKKRKRYVNFAIKKKSGKLRQISAPVKKLKQIQRGLNYIFNSIYTYQDSAYGFVPGKSIVDNARVHAGHSFVLNIDLKDFFPSINFLRVKKMLEKPPFDLNGDREPLAFLISNLCTEDGVLPQGAPTSPFFTNLICQRLDLRMRQLAVQYSANYSRYADDITFSCNDFIFTKRFLDKLNKIIKDEGFEINPEKTRIQGKGYRQEVTGLTVNEKVNVNRNYARALRTLKHIFKTKGAVAALEFHFKRMPASVLESRLKSSLESVEGYMEQVIMGKTMFQNMAKGIKEESLPVIMPFKTNGSKSITPELPSFIEEEEEFADEGFERPKVISSDTDKVLEIWAKEEGGFEKAMEYLKKLTQNG